MADVTFRRGSEANLPTQGMAEDGCVYQSIDTGNIYIGGDEGNLIPVNRSPYYGVCNTASSIATKIVALDVENDNFFLTDGTLIVVKFLNKNTALSPTLNVNGTGAVSVKRYETTGMGNKPSTSWNDGEVVAFVYDGEYWRHIGFNTMLSFSDIVESPIINNKLLTSENPNSIDSAEFELPIVTYDETCVLPINQITGYIDTRNSSWVLTSGSHYEILLSEDIVGIKVVGRIHSEFCFLNENQLSSVTEYEELPRIINASELLEINKSVPVFSDSKTYLYVKATDANGNNVIPSKITYMRLRDKDKMDKVYDSENGNVAIFDGSGGVYDSGVWIEDLVNAQPDLVALVTYSDLVTLKTGGNLVPGMKYRITNYTCTTTQTNTQSAGHLFDIIVTADSETELNENARVAHHSEDTYFQNCDLDSWEIKYCIENDTDRFIWADDTNGKGVIYYMKDDMGNECPYDFKNIQFKRWEITNCQNCTSLVVNNADNQHGIYYGAKDRGGNNIVSDATYGSNSEWFYTFSLKDDATGNIYDYSVESHRNLVGKDNYASVCLGNKISANEDSIEYQGSRHNSKTLNNIVFIDAVSNIQDSTHTDLESCISNTFGVNCSDSTFGPSCQQCHFLGGYVSNTAGSSFMGNKFEVYSHGNKLGNDFQINNVGEYFFGNTFGNGCLGNSFGNYFMYNQHGSGFETNDIGNYCYQNSFGNDCYANTLGNDFIGNSFGNYCKYITAFENVRYCNVTGGTSSANVKNAQILNGTQGTSSSNKLTITFAADQNYTQVAGLVNGTDLRIWVAEDTVTGPQTAVSGNIPVFSGTGSNSGKQIIDSGVSISDLSPDLVTPVTYSDLVTLKTGGNLVPGMQYRITNYTCTTTQANTQSAGHLFDIIVTADSETELNENARAAHHSGDTYFQNCDLDSWEIKYCLDNETDRFIWADDQNGKGVIYYMKDEWGNEAPYDFKNIQFKRWAVSEVTDQKMTQEALEALNDTFVFDGDETKFQARFGYKGSDCFYGSTLHVVDTNDTGWYYTFSTILHDVESEEYSLNDIEDGSIKGNNYFNDEGGGGFYGNTIKPRYDNMASGEDDINGAQVLNNIVLNGYYENSDENPYIYGCNKNSFECNCYDNTFGDDCQNNTFGNSCKYNSFGSSCSSNSFGNGCDSNSFGNYCYSNSFGNYCYSNSFGNGCYQNSFGNNCYYNTFGHSCNNNSFGNDCARNSFGNYCARNTFWNSCASNTFGNRCNSNTFGNDCQSNTFGNNCNSNSFWNSCLQNTFGNYCQSITVFDGVQYCDVTGGTNSLPVKNAQILNGTKGTSSFNKLTIAFTANQNYTQVAGLVNGTDLRIWIAEDTVTGPQTAVAGRIAVFTGSGSQSGKMIEDSGVTVADLSPDLVTPVTYSDLVILKTGGNLVPGSQYRITNYTCTTNQTNTSSASHAFDIIVTADSETELNENARAAHHSGDPYFTDCDLDAWELKYCLENDTNRFAWADDDNGTGVIFYMKDEWNNIAPFDFKNILFTRNTSWFNSHQQWAEDVLGSVPSTDMNFYFLSWVTQNNAIQDLSIVGQTLVNDEDTYSGVYNNEIKGTTAYDMGITEDATSTVFALPCTIIVSSYDYEGGCFYGCYSNTFGNSCYNNTFGNSCYDNTFGNSCYGNTFGSNCSRNSFGNGCGNNSFGESCNNNSFGSNFISNSFGYSCYQNTFGNNWSLNSFGNSCYGNSFGNSCSQNSFGNNFYSNSFGNSCSQNSFGNYCQTITVFDGVQNCNVTGGTNSLPVKNAQILNGTKGASSANKLTITFTANQNYTQVAGLVNGTDLRIWIAEDTVTGPQTAVAGRIAVFTGSGSQSGKMIEDSGVTVADLQVDVPEYTIEKLGTAETGYIASYVLKKDNVQVGATINIPKDYLVKSGSVVDVVLYEGHYYESTDVEHENELDDYGVNSEGKYLKFIINTADTSQGTGNESLIYISVSDLVDDYIAGPGIRILNQVDGTKSIAIKLSLTSNGLELVSSGVDSGLKLNLASYEPGRPTLYHNGAMTGEDKFKLDGIESGAEVNVQSDWNQTSDSADDYIKNKPDSLSDFTDDLGSNPVHTHSQYALSTDIPTKTSDLENDGSDGTSTYVESDELALVATTGSYNDLTDTLTEGNGIDISNSNTVSVEIDSSNANGLSVGANGVALATATTSSAGAMSATDKDKLDNLTDEVYHAGDNISIEESIPYGYTPLEYVYNSSNTYQDTGIRPTVDDVELEFEYRDSTSSLYQCLLGNMPTSTTTSHYGLGYFSSATITLYTKGTNISSGVNSVSGHGFYIKGILKNGNGSIYVKNLTNGTEGQGSGTYTFSETGYNIEIFRRRHNTTYMPSGARVYKAVIKIKGATVLNYIPAKRNSDNVCGFWDTVSKTFVTATAGQWNAGPVSSWEKHFTISAINIPTTTSELTNDSGFITDADIPVTDVTVGGTSVVDSNGIAVVPAIPDSTSDLVNDSGFITSADVPSPADAAPLMDGTATVGTSTDYAREDHIHPKDTSKADKVSNATEGNFAGLDSNGNLTDSGHDSSELVPSGGTTGQVLAKHSNTDNDVEWVTLDETELLVPIEYSDLVALKTGGNLVHGTKYRITDYACTTTQANTQSAGHVFDIIVTADSETELNENARAAHHSGDTYFADCDLDSWEIKYCLGNETNRFAWADDQNGKGVIYYMKDEWNNECPYDFKNIQFKRWAVTEVTDSVLNQDTVDALNEIFVFDGSDNSKFQARFGYKNSNSNYGSTTHVVDAEDSGWYYTFSIIMNDTDSGEFAIDNIEDGSIKGNNFYNDEGGGGFHGNSMKPRYNNMASDEGGIDGAQVLNNIVFNGYYENSEEAPYIYACFMNHLDGNCFDNTFGNDCNNNSFGNDCYRNSFGNYCCQNTFGASCNNNSFGSNFISNSFGNDCNNNSFGNNCGSSTFGNHCYRNSFGNSFSYNTFGNHCYRNSFGNSCTYSSYGNSCYDNTFGNSCNNSSFGNGYQGNILGGYCQAITVFDDVRFCKINGGTGPLPVKNAQILNGTKGTNSSNRLTISFTKNKNYTQVAGLVNGTDLRIWVAEDTVTGPQTAVSGNIPVFSGTGSDSGKQIIDSGVSISDLSPDLATPVTHSELVALKNGGNLVPGMQYRITNYTCTTNQTNTSSASHAFDIIVTADSETELNENARAAHHSEDTYFADCDLDAWELKYCLENDTDRFVWADDENGTGVIFYMKDEWNNIAPFDFKNILFTRNTSWFNSHQQWAEDVLGSVPSTNMNFYFLSWVTQNNTIQDLSIVGQTLVNDEDAYCGVYNNEIKGTTAYDMGITEDATSTAFALPCTIIVSSYSYEDGVFYGCYSNSFGNSCNNNSFGSNFISNSFGYNCYQNTFGNDCQSNTFGNNCGSNTFGNGCDSNSFGSNFISNSFGYNCYQNTFGNGCYGNTFGNNCTYNSFWNNCHSNSFGDYCQNITVFDGVQYCNVTGGTISSQVKNAQILNGTKGASVNRLTITFTANQNYTQIAGLVNGTDLRIWVAEDTVTGPQTAVSGHIAVFTGSGSQSGKQIMDSGVTVADLSPDLATPVTHSELVALKTGGNLVPGMQYRITNYTCTTTQANTQSAGHLFDIIVTADSETELNENARAAHHSGDTYFQNCNLDSWEIKYCLDNETDRFIWADDTNGKGVIYYMKDEWGNEAPYDFKNMLFTRSATWFNEHQSWATSVLGSVPSTDMNFYFLSWVTQNNAIQDLSIVGQTLTNDEDAYRGVYNNEIKGTTAYDMGITEDATSTAFALPCTIIVNSYNYQSGVFYGCYSNTFGNSCYNNTFGNRFVNVTFGDRCHSNTFGNSCYNNTFGNNCYSNSLGNGCINNSFGNHCSQNTFGENCFQNSFGVGCIQTTFGNYFTDNNFGNYCYSNSFGDYCRFLTVFGNVGYCNITGGTSSANIKNAQILNGTQGTSSSNKRTITFAADQNYTQIAGLVNGTTLRIWIAEDTVTGPTTAVVGDIPTFSVTSGKQITGSGHKVNELLPSGGTTGQVLAKESNANFDVEWVTLDETELLVPIEYSDLVTLKTGGNLVPGTKYRITDYNTTVSEDLTDVSVAEHQFDIIVTALSDTELDHRASAIQHEGDTYFSDCDLSKWQLWYDIENDTERYEWALDGSSSGNGGAKGSIPEYAPEYIYCDDIYGPLSNADLSTALVFQGIETMTIKGTDIDCYIYGTTVQADALGYEKLFLQDYPSLQSSPIYGIDDKEGIHTISVVDAVSSSTQPTNGTKIISKSITSGITTELLEKTGISPELEFNGRIVMYRGQNCYSYGSSAQYAVLVNEFKNLSDIIVSDGVSPIVPKKVDEPGTTIVILDDETTDPIATVSQETVVVGGNSSGTGVIYRMIDEWGNDCPYDFKNIMFTDDGDRYYTFDVFVNSVRYDFSVEQTLKSCYGNTIKSSIGKFGGNSYKYSLSRIIFKNKELSSPCNSNTLESGCDNNIFGDSCYRNSFGKYFRENIFGNNCRGNSFGNNCHSNSFGDYCQNITVFDGVQYCDVTGGTDSSPVKNAQILNGTKGASSANKLTITFTANQNYTQVAGLVNGTDLRIWVAEDTVTGPQTAVAGRIAVFTGSSSQSGKQIMDSGVTVADLQGDIPSPADAAPLMDGTATVGTSTDYAREDHIHPKDTSKADKVSNATEGNFAGLDSNGNLTDSGHDSSELVPSGGTTGQVLAKHSNTDNDVEWVTQVSPTECYWANQLVQSSASYITTPEVKQVTINGSTTDAVSTDHCIIVYDTVNKCLKFTF